MSNILKPLAGAFLGCVWTVGLVGLSSASTHLSSLTRFPGTELRSSQRYYAYQPRRIDSLRQTALGLANQDRARYGFSGLIADPLLSKAAQKHAEDMLRRGYFSHYSLEGRTPTDRFAAVGGRKGAAENILMIRDSSLPRTGVGLNQLSFFERGWMGSPGHRRNLLDQRHGRFGFGVAVAGDRLYAVQLFSVN